MKERQEQSCRFCYYCVSQQGSEGAKHTGILMGCTYAVRELFFSNLEQAFFTLPSISR